MPRINADTVEEHRRAQERALLDAAREIILKEGLGALSFGELSRRTELARSSIYEYFSNKDALVMAILDDARPAWKAVLERAVDGGSSPRERIRMYVHTQLQLVADGRHELGFALVRGPLSEKVRSYVEDKHLELLSVLKEPLESSGIEHPEIILGLIAGTLQAATERIRSGLFPSSVISSTVRFVGGGLTAMIPEAPADSETVSTTET